MILEIDKFLSKKNLEFSSKSKKLTWVKSLKPETYVKIGTSILIDEQEMDELYIQYIQKQVKLRKKRQQSAKRTATIKKQNSEGKKTLTNNE